MSSKSKICELLKCSFCLNPTIEARSGATTCPEVNAHFEIDDRLKCVFADPNNIRLSAIGTVCSNCGLIQAGSHQNCLNCGAVIYTEVQ